MLYHSINNGGCGFLLLWFLFVCIFFWNKTGFVLLIIDISKHGAKEMGHVKLAGPGFVNDVTA
jgi:hypothetical protein